MQLIRHRVKKRKTHGFIRSKIRNFLEMKINRSKKTNSMQFMKKNSNKCSESVELLLTT